MRIYSLLLLFVLLFGCKKEGSNIPGLPDSYSNQPVGNAAVDLLQSGHANSLTVEIQYMTGYAPDNDAIIHLQNVLQSILRKPSGINIIQREITAQAQSVYALDEIKTIEKNNRTAYSSNANVAVYILIVNGNYTEPAVLGAAYRSTSIVMLGKTIHENSGGIGQASRTKLEATVMEHEFGHLCGLVNITTPMQTSHQDTAHGNHCSNSSCLMYYAAETTDILGFLITGNIPSFDDNCLNDMHANGGL